MALDFKMNTLPLASLELLGGGRVAVAPVHPDAAYQYVYRAALGVEWSEKLQKFLSPSDYMLECRRDFSVAENMACLTAALNEEMGLQLVTTEATIWVGFKPEQRAEAQRILDAQPTLQADVHASAALRRGRGLS